jgi:Protein of unknown function (DUF4242)
MREYLVEVYVPRSGAANVRETAARARATAEQLSAEGTAVRYVRAMFVPEDETCFHVFKAVSHEAVKAATERAGFPAQRIVETAGTPPDGIKPERRMR